MNQKRQLQVGDRIRFTRAFLQSMGVTRFCKKLLAPLGIVFEIVSQQQKVKGDCVRYRTDEGYVGSALARNVERCKATGWNMQSPSK